MLDASFTWETPPTVLAARTAAWGERLLDALYALGQVFAARIESAAKRDAPWTDRTTHARQGLTARAERTARGFVLYLYHLATYGIWLEVAHAGRYQIILPTLERHYGPLMAAIYRLVR